MNNYLPQRLLQFILVVFGITIVTFCLMRLIPGDPCQMTYGEFVPRENIERCRVEYGLDEPIPRQFFIYLSGLFSGNSIAGQSIVYQRPAASVLMQRLPVTVFLASYGSLLAILLGLVVGIGSR
jgi:peptide/nickel transport system permease protein